MKNSFIKYLTIILGLLSIGITLDYFIPDGVGWYYLLFWLVYYGDIIFYGVPIP